MRDTFRSWKLPRRSDKAIEDLSRMFNPIIRGWIQYYGRYYRSALYPTMRELDRDLAFWAKRKYKKLCPISAERHTGSHASRVALRSCSPTGRWGYGVAP
jgi:RNA-directed DNA polymerase